jgi:hypothetical protein
MVSLLTCMAAKLVTDPKMQAMLKKDDPEKQLV